MIPTILSGAPVVLAEVASDSQQRWSGLYYLYMSIALVVGALVLGWLITSMIRFRARPGELPPRDAPRAGYVAAERGHVIWSWIIALVIASIMFGLAFSTIHAVDATENAPAEGEHVYLGITGFQFGWKVDYTAPGGIPVQTIGDWYAPVDTVVVTNVTSQDVWHNWALPDFRIRVDAIPGETNHIWFRAQTTGITINQCVQICGSSHALMKANLHIVSKDEFKTWLDGEANKAFTRAAGRGLVANGTFDGVGFTGLPASLPSAKGTYLNITNGGATPVTFSLNGATTEQVAPGGYGHLYLPALSKSAKLMSSTGATTEIPVVS